MHYIPFDEGQAYVFNFIGLGTDVNAPLPVNAVRAADRLPQALRFISLNPVKSWCDLVMYVAKLPASPGVARRRTSLAIHQVTYQHIAWNNIKASHPERDEQSWQEADKNKEYEIQVFLQREFMFLVNNIHD